MKKQDLLIENNKISTKNYYKRRFLPSINFGAEGELDEIKDKGIGPERVSMKIDLDIGGQALNEYKIKKNSLEIAELNRTKNWFSLEEEVISTYFQYLSVRKNLNYIKKTLNILKKQQEKLEKMLKGGNLIPKNELLKIEIEIEESNLQSISNELKEDTLKQKLFTLMGLELDQNIDFRDVNVMSLIINEKGDNLDSIEQVTSKESINSKINRLEIENSIYDNKIAKAELLPEFYIKPEYLFDDVGYDKKGARVTVGFNWNFEWGNTLNDIEISNNNIKISEMDYLEKTSNQKLEIRNNFEQLKMAKLSLKITNKKIELMRENLKLDTSRFENRLMGSTEYLSSVNSLKEAEEKLYEQQQEIFLLNLKLKNLTS